MNCAKGRGSRVCLILRLFNLLSKKVLEQRDGCQNSSRKCSLLCQKILDVHCGRRQLLLFIYSTLLLCSDNIFIMFACGIYCANLIILCGRHFVNALLFVYTTGTCCIYVMFISTNMKDVSFYIENLLYS